MIYVFKNIDEATQAVSYGFVPEDKIQDKTLMDQLVFKKIDTLPEPPENSDGKEYFLKYDEAAKKFYFEV